MRRAVGMVALALAAALAAAGAGAAGPEQTTVIDLTYDSVMDMVRPEVRPGIKVHHRLQVTVSGYDRLSEQRDRSTHGYRDENRTVQVLGSTDDEHSYVSWKVAADGTLVREQNDPQSTRTMTVTLLPGNKCTLEVVDRLKPGFKEWEFLRITMHTMAFFSSYEVKHTSCSVR
ncbi:MAG TPA: hypothetical protein VMU06_21250 [Stellaceae bacterium]|nr:hypothetical protein [Stellaceae bacterium]